MSAFLAAGAIAVSASAASAADPAFGPFNPFYSVSTLPFHAPPFDKIKDEDYQPALEAGMAQELVEIHAIANNPDAPTFENTLVAMEKSGLLLSRTRAAFSAVTGANTNPTLEKVKAIEAPKFAAHNDAIYLDAKLFARVKAVYNQRAALNLDPESMRLVEVTYDDFVHQGANLSDHDKIELKKLNEELSTLSNAFSTRLLAATKAGAYVTTDKTALAGLSDARLSAASKAASDMKPPKTDGYSLSLQNTTQQPDLVSLTDRTTRQAIFENSWNRAEKGDANDTRDTVAHIAQLRARRAQLLGYSSHAAWKLEDQMAKTPEAALKIYGRAGAGRDGKGSERRPGYPGSDRCTKGRLLARAVGLEFLFRTGAQGEV